MSMKGKLIICKYLVWPGAAGWACWPFIIFRAEKYATPKRVNHERIHLAQQREMLVVPFYLAYVLNFIWNLIRMRPRPYRDIKFEREAFQNEADPTYLETRKFWAWINY